MPTVYSPFETTFRRLVGLVPSIVWALLAWLCPEVDHALCCTALPLPPVITDSSREIDLRSVQVSVRLPMRAIGCVLREGWLAPSRIAMLIATLPTIIDSVLSCAHATTKLHALTFFTCIALHRQTILLLVECSPPLQILLRHSMRPFSQYLLLNSPLT